MIIEVTAGSVAVRDADDCGRFHVESALAGQDLDQALRAASAGHGGPDGAAWIGANWVRSTVDAASPSGVGTDWTSRFEAMLSYARGKGWLDESATHIRAHVEPPPVPAA